MIRTSLVFRAMGVLACVSALAVAAEPAGQPPGGVKIKKRIENAPPSNPPWSRSAEPSARSPADLRSPTVDLPAGESAARAARGEDAAPPPSSRVAISPPGGHSPASDSLSPTGRMATSIAAPLGMAEVATQLPQVTFAQRLSYLDELERRLSKTETAFAGVRAQQTGLGSDGRKQLETSVSGATQRAEGLRRSLRAARESNETGWPQARTQLEQDLRGYADSLAQLDALLGPPAARR